MVLPQRGRRERELDRSRGDRAERAARRPQDAEPAAKASPAQAGATKRLPGPFSNRLDLEQLEDIVGKPVRGTYSAACVSEKQRAGEHVVPTRSPRALGLRAPLRKTGGLRDPDIGEWLLLRPDSAPWLLAPPLQFVCRQLPFQLPRSSSAGAALSAMGSVRAPVQLRRVRSDAPRPTRDTHLTAAGAIGRS